MVKTTGFYIPCNDPLRNTESEMIIRVLMTNLRGCLNTKEY
jgi:hypothetical protein